MMMMVFPRSVEPMQNIEQLTHIVEVQAGCRFVQQVKGPTGLAFAQFARQLDSLRLASGERHRRLSEV